MDTFNVNDISFGYAAKDVLYGVSFDVRRGDFLTVLGQNGTGKTTLLRLLSGILSPQKGAVLLEGVDIKKYKRGDIARKIAVVSQSFSIEFPFSVEEVVLMGRYPYQGRFGLTNKEDMMICGESMEQADVSYLKGRVIFELSAGEMQRVLIARALCQSPSIILLDEPTTHLDINHQIELNSIIRRLNKESGLTVINISHDLNAASMYSDKIMLLKDKRIFVMGVPGDVITENNIKAVFDADIIVKSEKDVPYVVLKSM